MESAEENTEQRRLPRRSAPHALSKGRYELLEFVGKGGMGAVYRARDLELDRPVAIKCLLDLKGNSTNHDAAIREARTLASLNHPNIMRVFDILTEDDQAWIISEWLDGNSLAGLPHPMSTISVLAIMCQVFDALAAAHAAGVVHRDIKPANVMAGRDGRIRLIDFGVAYAPGTSSGETIAGSMRYTDPRILEGEAADAASDLYSAALLMVELLSGHQVLPDLAPLPLYRHIKRGLESRLDELLDGVYPPLAELTRTLTAWREPATVARTASEAARHCSDLLDRLTSRSPDQVLADALAAGEIGAAAEGEGAVMDLMRQEAWATLNSPELPPQQKAAWVAFLAHHEHCAGQTGTCQSEAGAGRDRSRGTVLAAEPPAEAPEQGAPIWQMGWFGGALAVGVLVATTVWINATQERAGRLDGGNAPVPAETREGTGPQTAGGGTPGNPPTTMSEPAAANAAVPVQIVANAWAVVKVDGIEIGRLPQAAPFMMLPGHHVLELTNPTVEPLTTNIVIQAGQPLKLQLSLTPLVTSQRFRLKSPGRLYIDGQDHGVVRGTATVPLTYGTHKIWVKRAKSPSSEPQNIALQPGGPKEIVLE